MKVAGIQLSACESVSETIDKAESWIEAAVTGGAQMVCLPELFANEFIGREKRPEWKYLAETIDGPLISRMKHLSGYHEIGLLTPFYEWDPNTNMGYNSAVFIDRGRTLATYRKTYIPETTWNFERFYFAPGSGEIPVVQIGNVNFASIICYDRHFPELARLATFRGAQVLFVPTASADRLGRTNIYLSELVGLAAANGLYVMGVNRTGVEDSTIYFGGSGVVAPDGTVIDQIGREEGLIWCNVDVDSQNQTRAKFGHLRDVREDVLRELADLVGKETVV